MRSMESPIRGASNCIVYSVTLNLTMKNDTGAATHWKSCEVFGEDVMSEQKVNK